jgi:large subunit ribosomal protein L17
MRHRVAHRKLGRVTEHRIAMLRNQATSLLRYEHLTTTVPRAKELRPFVERLITIAKRGVAGGDTNGHVLNARRLVMHDLQDREVVTKLFDTIAPRFASRPGGYTRLLRLGFRKGDSAEVAQVELIGSEFDPKAKAEADAKKTEGEKPKAKGGVGGRLRAAAERLRGGKKAAGAESESAAATEAKAAKRAAKKGTAGKKMGGSSKGK